MSLSVEAACVKTVAIFDGGSRCPATAKSRHKEKNFSDTARSRSSGPLGALLSSPALDVRLPTALQVLQVLQDTHGKERCGPRR